MDTQLDPLATETQRRLRLAEQEIARLNEQARELKRQLGLLQGHGNIEPLSRITAWERTDSPSVAAGTALAVGSYPSFVGVGQKLLAGRAISFNKLNEYIEIAGESGPCYTIIVDSSGGGDFNTLAAALASLSNYSRGDHVSIWMCNDETISSTITLPTCGGSSGVIDVSIETAAARVEITCPGGNGMLLASNSNTNYYRFRWRNIDFVGTGSGDPWMTANVNTGGEECSNEFWNCSWSNTFGALIRQTVLACGPQGHTYLFTCSGTFTYFYQETVSNAQGYPGSWRIANKSSFTVTSGMWTLGSGIHPVGSFTIEGNSDITSTGTNFIGAFSFNGMPLILRECTITHSGSGHCINKTPGTTNYFRDVTIICTNAAARAISSSSASGTDYIDGLIAINTAGSTEYAVNISGDTVYLGTVLQSGYAGPYTGATPSSGIAHSSLSGLTTGDDHTQYTKKETLTTKGDMYYASAASTPARLGVGTDDTQFLGAHGGIPTWQTKAPLTTKGDIYTYGTTFDRLAVGTDGQILSADGTTSTGLKWIDSSGGSGSGGGGLVTMVADPLGIEWTDMPAAATELFGLTNCRTAIDLTNASTVRLVVNVLTAGATGAVLRAQYSLDSGSTWNYLDGSTGPEVAIDATGVAAGTVVNLETDAQADVWLRVIGVDGDGATDPVFGLLLLEFDTVSGGTVSMAALTSQNEVKNWPMLETADSTQPVWWNAGSNATLTNEDVAGESVTEWFERALKVVTSADNSFSYQRYTYADEGRVKAGRTYSAGVWVLSPSGAAARIRLKSSVGTSVVSADTTSSSWTFLVAEGIVLDGTYVDIQLEVDTGTAYFADPVVMQGARCVPLGPRNLRFREVLPTATALNSTTAKNGVWTDVDASSYVPPLAAMVQCESRHSRSVSGQSHFFVKRKGDGTTDSPATGATFSAKRATYGTGNVPNETEAYWTVLLTDAQLFQYTNIGGTVSDRIDVTGYWYWE